MTGSPLANPGATRALLEAYGLATKHSLGQNFLVNNHVIEKITDLAELGEKDRVLEVGPGIGTLTLALLAEAGRVVSVEMDRELEPVLSAHATAYPNFSFIMGDALRVTPDQIAEAAGGEPDVLVANLPYNVAATIILAYLQRMPSLRRLVVMVQAEVADRICADPGNRTYGAYTAKLALLARVTGRFEVGPGNFMPPRPRAARGRRARGRGVRRDRRCVRAAPQDHPQLHGRLRLREGRPRRRLRRVRHRAHLPRRDPFAR